MKTLKAHKIIEQIKTLQNELRKHQELCKHKRVEKVSKSNTGNWDPNDDSYWYSCYCPTCLKRWNEDQ